MASESPQVEEVIPEVHAQDATEPVTDGEGEGEGADDKETAEAPAEEVEALTVTIGAAPAPSDEEQQASTGEPQGQNWVKELRERNRAQSKRIRELEAKEAQRAGIVPVVEDKPEPPPSLRDSDWDEEKHAEKTKAWGKREALRESKAAAKVEEAKKAATAIYTDFSTKAAKLSPRVDGFDDAIATVMDTLNVNQQNMVLRAASDSAIVFYALGRDEKKARDLAAIDDPIKFIAAVARLEAEVKVQPRKKDSKPSPDSPVRGSNGSPSTGKSKDFDRAIEKAQKTGDASELMRLERERTRKQK